MQLIFLFDFSLVTLEEDDSIAVKVRGPANNEKECFFFLEEILGCVDQVSGKISQLSTTVLRHTFVPFWGFPTDFVLPNKEHGPKKLFH